MTHRINSPWFWAMLIAAELLLGCAAYAAESIRGRATALRSERMPQPHDGLVVGGWPLGMEWQSLLLGRRQLAGGTAQASLDTRAVGTNGQQVAFPAGPLGSSGVIEFP